MSINVRISFERKSKRNSSGAWIDRLLATRYVTLWCGPRTFSKTFTINAGYCQTYWPRSWLRDGQCYNYGYFNYGVSIKKSSSKKNFFFTSCLDSFDCRLRKRIFGEKFIRKIAKSYFLVLKIWKKLIFLLHVWRYIFMLVLPLIFYF